MIDAWLEPPDDEQEDIIMDEVICEDECSTREIEIEQNRYECNLYGDRYVH